MLAASSILPTSNAANAQTGVRWAPGEYEAVYGPIVAWEPGSYLPLLTDFVVGVTNDSNMDSLAFVVVRDSSQEASAYSTLASNGADMDRVRFIHYNLDTVWLCDYGPRYIYEDGSPAIIDHEYNRPRTADNNFPGFVRTADTPFSFDEDIYEMDLTHGGGNLHVFSDGEAFMSTLVEDENPSKSRQQILDIIEDNFGVSSVTIYDRLISNVDYTGHIDMWMLPVSDNAVIISEFPSSHTQSKASTDAAAADMASRGYTVYRTPAYNTTGEGSGGTHYTYTNAAIVNNTVFIPWYDHAADDAQALSVYQTAFPGYTIVQVDCRDIIGAAGAIHCVMKHVYCPTTPYGEILNPNGGESLLAGEECEIKWIANDDDDITSIDLYYSTDGGATYPNVIATGEVHDGYYTWTIPSVVSDTCRIKLVVHDNDTNTYEDTSDADFGISCAVPYDFEGITSPSSSHTAEDGEIDVTDSMIQNASFPARRGSGIPGWSGWGEASTGEYGNLFGSDENRYQGSDPGWGDNAAMIFEFCTDPEEDLDDLKRIDVSLEMGRGSATEQGWIYLWNYALGQYTILGTHIGSADQLINASITVNPANYVDPITGEITLFVVNQNTSNWIRVDNISLRCHWWWDKDGDGYYFWEDCNDWDDTVWQRLPGYVDADGDGYGTGCQHQVCSGDTLAAGYAAVSGDCDDNDPTVNPGMTEITCNGKDDDCNPATLDNPDGDGDGVGVCDDCDDSNNQIWQLLPGYVDADGDGYGTGSELQVCSGASLPAGYASVSGDCDDADAAVNPGAAEITCNGIDDDCNPATEDNLDVDGDGVGVCDDCDDSNNQIWQLLPGYVDADGDGYGTGSELQVCSGDTLPAGYAAVGGDCDDNDPTVNPGMTEIPYNGKDDDCNPATLDDDLDQDGYPIATDCDDNDPSVNPGMTEIPYNGKDDDCNPATLDDDLDQDGYPIATDCDDSNPDVNPGASEICANSIDDDCDGFTDGDDPDCGGTLWVNFRGSPVVASIVSGSEYEYENMHIEIPIIAAVVGYPPGGQPQDIVINAVSSDDGIQKLLNDPNYPNGAPGSPLCDIAMSDRGLNANEQHYEDNGYIALVPIAQNMGSNLYLIYRTDLVNPNPCIQIYLDYIVNATDPCAGQARVIDAGFTNLKPAAPDWDVDCSHHCDLDDIIPYIRDHWDEFAAPSWPNGWVRADIDNSGHVDLDDIIPYIRDNWDYWW